MSKFSKVNYRPHDPDECMNPYHHCYGIYSNCGECLNCKRSGHVGMSMSPIVRAFETQEDRKRAMQSVHELQNKPSRLASYAHAIGTPDQHVRAILDAHVLRRRLTYVGRKGRITSYENIYAIYARAGATAGQPDPGTLFWDARVWFHLRKATYSSSALESSALATLRRNVFAGFAPDAAQYRTLASWACRLCSPQRELLQICGEICNQFRVEGRWDDREPFKFPSAQTRSWLLWLSQSCQKDCEWPDERLGTFTSHRDRWLQLATGLSTAIRVVMALQAPRFKNHLR